jgi:YD repeat-containing protein
MLIVLYSLIGYNGTMFSCYILIVMLAFGFTGAVSAQTNPGSPAPVPAASAGEAVPGTVSGGGVFFPLSLLIETALSGSLLWHPDWPMAIPPDSFEPARQPGVSVILTLEAVQETGDPVSTEFWYSRDSGGRLTGFPYFINGVFCQAQAFFDPQDGVLRGMRVVGEGDPREIEFTSHDEGLPLLGRVVQGGVYSFTVFQYLGREITESWFDEAGGALGFVSLKYRNLNGRSRLATMEIRSAAASDTAAPNTGNGDAGARNTAPEGGGTVETTVLTTYDYDSAGKLSGVSAPEGNYTALYTAEGRLRYWEKPGGSYTLQWDERGLLTGLTGTVMADSGDGSESAGQDREEVNVRYEYTFDERENWTERQEFPLIRRFGVLVSGPGPLVRRTVAREGER